MDEILTSLKVGVIIGSATDESCCSGVCFGSDGMPEKNVASGRDTLSFFFGVFFFLVVPRTRPSVVLRQRRESHHGYVGWHPCFCEAGPFFFFSPRAPSMCHIPEPTPAVWTGSRHPKAGQQTDRANPTARNRRPGKPTLVRIFRTRQNFALPNSPPNLERLSISASAPLAEQPHERRRNVGVESRRA